jgi:TPR repeat protein
MISIILSVINFGMMALSAISTCPFKASRIPTHSAVLKIRASELLCMQGIALINDGYFEDARKFLTSAVFIDHNNCEAKPYLLFCLEVLNRLPMVSEKNSSELAELNIGRRYEYGPGVAISYSEAAKWYLKAAMQGNTDAQLSLGTFYFRGVGVTQSYPESKKWINLSALHGNIDAQRFLGVMYAGGIGFEQSDELGAYWLQMAADRGCQHSQLALEALEAKMLLELPPK